MRVLLLGVAMCAVLLLGMNAQGRVQAGPAWVIDPGKSYGPYRLGTSVREVGTILKWPDATINELENLATVDVPPGNDGVGFAFESSSLTRITVFARSARTPAGVGVGSTLFDVVRVFGGDPRTEFRELQNGIVAISRRSGPRCMFANVDYNAANARVMVDVEYRDRGIEFMLTAAVQRPLLVEILEVFAPQACLPGD